MKKILLASFIGAMLLFSGCSSNSDGEDRLVVQQMLDDGDYSGVISKLASVENKNEEENLALAAAYMGSAGFGFADVVTTMADSSEGSSNNAFAKFATSIKENSNPSALSDIGNAIKSYEAVVGESTCDDVDANLTYSQKDICFFIGLSSVTQAATTLNYLGDLSDFGSSDGSDNQLSASACAMGYAYSGVTGAGCTISEGGDVTFDSNNIYTQLEVIVNAKEFDYLITQDSPKQTIITDGICQTNFSTDGCNQNTTAPTETGCYICPVNQDPNGDELTVANLLVDVLDTGLDAVVATLDVDSEIAADIEAFEAEVAEASGTVTVDSIIDYINAQN